MSLLSPFLPLSIFTYSDIDMEREKHSGSVSKKPSDAEKLAEAQEKVEEEIKEQFAKFEDETRHFKNLVGSLCLEGCQRYKDKYRLSLSGTVAALNLLSETFEKEWMEFLRGSSKTHEAVRWMRHRVSTLHEILYENRREHVNFCPIKTLAGTFSDVFSIRSSSSR